MDQNFQYSDKLYNQILVNKTKVGYSHTIHIKSVLVWTYAERLTNIALWIFCAFATSSIIGYMVANEGVCVVIGIVSSLLSTIVSTIVNTMDFKTPKTNHKSAADALWRIREEYESLIVDYSTLDVNQRILRRNMLLQETDKIYRNSPATGPIAKFIAMRALKSGEQTIDSDDFQRMG